MEDFLHCSCFGTEFPTNTTSRLGPSHSLATYLPLFGHCSTLSFPHASWGFSRLVAIVYQLNTKFSFWHLFRFKIGDSFVLAVGSKVTMNNSCFSGLKKAVRLRGCVRDPAWRFCGWEMPLCNCQGMLSGQHLGARNDIVNCFGMLVFQRFCRKISSQ